MRTKLILVLAIVMGLITTFLFYQYISQFDDQAAAAREENVMEIVVANKPIAKNQRITSELLGTAVVSADSVPPSVVVATSDAIGRFALSDMIANEPLLAHRIGDEKEEALFVSRKLAEGKRAVSVGVNFVQSVSNLIEPEDQVDVIFSDSAETDAESIESELLLENVRVLAVGRRMLESSSGEDYAEYSAVTLELSVEQAVTVVNASQRGSLQLILHSRIHAGEESDHDSADTL